MYQAIETHFIGPTNHRGARIVARSQAGRVAVPWDHALSVADNHIAAARALASKLAWDGAWIGGASADGRGYAFASLRGAEGADFHVG